MCGIAGLIDITHHHSLGEIARQAAAMNSCLMHRGPDDEGIWVDPVRPVAFAQRRLAIVDLSTAGHQPMVSSCDRYVITYNGEIYNHEELRAELVMRGIKFRGQSDTEVMLEAISSFGLNATLSKLIGMFAFALWDRQERAITLVRDRLGIKPLFWAKFGGLFLFGSELKALRAHPGWTPTIDRGAVASFLRHSYVPAPRTIYEGVYKLEPGTVLTMPWRGEPRIERYWDSRKVALAGLTDPLRGSDGELIDMLEDQLTDSVKRQMIADVPLGAFLSGGVDSSTVVALMQKSHTQPVRTFSISFENDEYNEAHHAAAVARHLGTNHTELTVTPRETLDVIPKLPEWYDEPFGDTSQIPTSLISAMTRKHVTVALSGDGGDELFAGYNRYQLAVRSWPILSLLPRPVRAGLASSIVALPPERWSSMLRAVPGLPSQAGDKLHKLASILGLRDGDAVYRRLVSHWEPADLMSDTVEPRGVLWDERLQHEMPSLLERMQLLDLITYLPDDILTKVDRASMAVALEVRVPLIDHRIVSMAWRLPRKVKIRNNQSKWILRQVLYRHVPRKLIERPKMGFGVPIGEWLRGPLRGWAETLMAEPRLRAAGLVDANVVRSYWNEHLSGRRNWEHLLWNVLMLEAWRERWHSA